MSDFLFNLDRVVNPTLWLPALVSPGSPLEPAMPRRQRNELTEQPSTGSQNQEEATLPNDKQGRLLSLAKELQKLFPEQYEGLAEWVEKMGCSKEPEGSIKSHPIAIPGKDNKATQDHIRTASGGSTTSNLHDQQEEQEREEIDPRGRAPEQKDPLIHIFVDHSNILYGLPQPKSATPYRERSNTLPTQTMPTVTRARVDSVAAPTAVATSSRPLPVSSTGSNATQFLSRSFPTASPLAGRTSENPDGDGGLGVEDTDARQKQKKPSRRLWYAALILVLERGRPVARRVSVASKKPMETVPIGTMERFGYEVRVLTRVPDTGKGGLSKVGHAKGISLSTSPETNSGRNASGSSLDPNYGKIHVLGNPSNKVKYREQGVDELLQLKIYQAITDPEPDDIPDGSTIVLATGDGGPGQFDQQGFLGPIKTALRLGWNVELYAWEDSLSRAWEREFGEKTKSGKGGVFRIIGMKQFERWLAYD